MKLLHTADWHLGKTLKGQNLLDDQKFILDEIFKIIDDEKPDAILICGDIYDRNVPPVDAVELFNETLTKLAEKNLPTLIISGNHDSAKRLNFGNKIFERQKIFIAARISDEPKTVVLEDDFGEIYFSMIPFFVPVEIKYKFFGKNSDSPTYNAANKFYVDLARKKIPAGKRSVALAHVFISGETKTESVREIVGGAEGISAEIFSEYNYVALGHLHRPRCSWKNIFYSGSPLKYSFDEAAQKKSVALVELDANGNFKVTPKNLKPRRDLVVVEGKFNELKNRAPIQDYAQIILEDDAYIYSTEELRDAFPNFLEVKRKSHLQSYDDVPTNTFRKEDPVSEQFAKFFEEVNGAPLTDDERKAFGEILNELGGEERE